MEYVRRSFLRPSNAGGCLENAGWFIILCKGSFILLQHRLGFKRKKFLVRSMYIYGHILFSEMFMWCIQSSNNGHYPIDSFYTAVYFAETYQIELVFYCNRPKRAERVENVRCCTIWTVLVFSVQCCAGRSTLGNISYLNQNLKWNSYLLLTKLNNAGFEMCPCIGETLVYPTNRVHRWFSL